MKLRNIFTVVLSALLVAVGITSCKQAEIIPDDVQAFYVITTPYISRDSIFEGGQHIIFRSVGEEVSLLDASRGVVKRTWFLDGGDVLEHDNNTMVEGDSLIKVRYDNPGIYTVRLLASLDSTDLFYYDTVNDTAKDEDGNILLDVNGNDSINCLNCKLVPYAPPGVLDTTFTVEVFDSLQADFSVMQNGVVEETFEAGVPVEFIDETLGTPYDWEWTLRGADPGESTDQNPSAVWKKSGTYRITLRASRPYVEGDVEREARTITKDIVITPSTAPLEFLNGGSSEAGDYIDLSFNQPLIDLPGANEFTVEVNGAPFNIFKTSFPNSNDSSVLRLELDGTMPSSSMYTVTSTTNIVADGKNLSMPVELMTYFKGAGNLFPVGFGDMEGVTPEGLPVVPNTTRNTIEGLFTNGTINAVGEPNGTQTYWKRMWADREDSTMMTEANDNPMYVLDGNYSMKWTPGDAMVMEQHPARGPSFSLTTGASYKVVLWMMAEGGQGDVNIEIKKGGGTVQQVEANVMVSDTEWTRIEIPHVAVADGLHNIKFINNAAGTVYYIDEVSVFEE
ncbi:PKD domain-containing protein [Pontibacter sp. G13]|uniref:PKD domain-containing protein n=1 Tax=Pontibacter sp. G13 TaxID=3074898 RepID=UPI0028899872|nr:PKD domain-containing protein [Pontibacter sp. G13]WNJ16559.1 carbohydrate binding domain-containing protein [Pontibacter sp. G13]